MGMLEDIAEVLPEAHAEYIENSVRFFVREAEHFSQRAFNDQGKMQSEWREKGLRTPFDDVVFQFANDLTLLCMFSDDEGENPHISVRVIIRSADGQLSMIPYAFLLQSNEIKLTVEGINNSKRYDTLDKAMRDRVDVMLYTLIAVILALADMSTEYVDEPAKLNKKRLKNSKPPIQDYHILHLGKRLVKKSASHGGKHASPAMHNRRGHFRRYQSGKTTWVREATVGKKENGIQLKNYVITGKGE